MADSMDEETAGALLFEIAAACRSKGIDPESALKKLSRAVQYEAERLLPNRRAEMLQCSDVSKQSEGFDDRSSA